MRLTVTRLATAAAFLLLAAPLAAEAQAPAQIPRVGYVSFGAEQSPFDEAFRRRLRELGYVEGQNVAIEYRFAAGRADRLDEVVAELVQRKVDVIITAGEVAVRAAKRATNKIPIIMAASPDPVGTGLVASLARPGGNITGLTTLSTELSAKRLELLKEVVPQLARVAVLTFEVDRGTASFVRELEAPALRL